MGVSERKKAVLYTGIDPKHFKTTKPLIHLPLMEIVARPFDSMEITAVLDEVLEYTHFIFTSKSSVKIFFDYYRKANYEVNLLQDKYIIAIGQVTAYYLKEEGIIPTYIAADETEASLIRVLSSIDLKDAKILLPRSSDAKPILSHFLVEHDVHHRVCTLYDTYGYRPFEVPPVEDFDEVIFTEPCTVESFFKLYEEIPLNVKLHPIGDATREALREQLHQRKMTSKALV